MYLIRVLFKFDGKVYETTVTQTSNVRVNKEPTVMSSPEEAIAFYKTTLGTAFQYLSFDIPLIL